LNKDLRSTTDIHIDHTHFSVADVTYLVE